PNGYNLPSAKQHYFNTVIFALMALTLALILIGFAQGSAKAGKHGTKPVVSFTGLLPSLVPIAFYWYASVVVIIAVHIYAVVIAHRHLLRMGVSRKLELASEYPWLAAMV